MYWILGIPGRPGPLGEKGESGRPGIPGMKGEYGEKGNLWQILVYEYAMNLCFFGLQVMSAADVRTVDLDSKVIKVNEVLMASQEQWVRKFIVNIIFAANDINVF